MNNRMIQLTAVGLLRPVAAAGALAVLAAVVASAADAEPPRIDPKADALLQRMSDCLAQAPAFSVTAEIWQDIDLASGLRVQAGRSVELQVRRPNRFHAEVRSTRRNRGLFYDGTSITLLNRVQAFYGTIPAPATLDAALDAACEKFGIAMPLEDIVVSDPYQSAMRRIVAGRYLGPVTVLGVPCEHLVFSLGSVDWQVWIQQGAVPVPRKIVITYKDEEDEPEYTAIFSNWDLQTKLPDYLFVFEPPAGATKIDVTELKSKNAMQHHPEGK